jgi:monoamine oxidase
MPSISRAGCGIPPSRSSSKPVPFFAGEATDDESLGTVEAALASGKRAARQVLRALR